MYWLDRIASILHGRGFNVADDWRDNPRHRIERREATAYARGADGRLHAHTYIHGAALTHLYKKHRHPLIYDEDGKLLLLGPAEDKEGRPLPDGHSHSGPTEARQRWLDLKRPEG